MRHTVYEESSPSSSGCRLTSDFVLFEFLLDRFIGSVEFFSTVVVLSGIMLLNQGATRQKSPDNNKMNRINAAH